MKNRHRHWLIPSLPCVPKRNIAASAITWPTANFVRSVPVTRRDPSVICVVEDTRDVLAIENTAQFKGLYHVLGGIISPVEGIGPGDLHIDSLLERLQGPERQDIREIILALSPTMEGDTTAFYLQKKLKPYQLRISTIARGVPIGGDLEYADEVTLGRSILSRIAYE